MDNADTLPIGTAVGHFRIVRLIGRGGFGITYEAWDSSLNRPVAIKEYFPYGRATRAHDGAGVECGKDHAAFFRKGLGRFLDEARTLAQFRDPRIVHVHGYQEAHGTAYMIMDFERGSSLREVVLQHGVLSAAQARSVLLDLLQGLRVIHARKYLHRDIKPANLLRRPDGQVVLLDFGSARLAQGETGEGHTVMVTPGYAPLEQYDEKGGQGPGTDLYATGASLLFCLTGEAPPDGLKRALAMQEGLQDPLDPILAAIAGKGPAAAELTGHIRWMMQPHIDLRPKEAQDVLSRVQPGEAPLTGAEPTLMAEGPNLRLQRSIPAKLVEPMRQHLESLIGAQATPLLFGAIRAAANAQDLVDRISAKIADPEVQARAVSGLVRILGATQVLPPAVPATATMVTTSTPGRMGTPPGGPPSSPQDSPPRRAPTSPLADEHSTQFITRALAKFIGPIATMLVRKGMAKASSRAELIDQLAEEISNPADREAFRRELLKFISSQ
jgi:serine/threonine protein kinase